MTYMNEYLPERPAADPLQAMEPDSDIEAIADAMISISALRNGCGGDAAFKESARQLLCTCLGYPRDWCSLEQRTVGNLKALPDAVRPSTSGSTTANLGDLFYEIESGCKRVTGTDGITMSWEPTTLERSDGTCPRGTNGIRPEDDFCLGYYKRFTQGTAPTTRTSIAVSLSRTLPGREGQEGGSLMAQGRGNPEINKKVATSTLVTLLVSVVGFYLDNHYWGAVASLDGQFFEHWGDGLTLMWPLIVDTPTHLNTSPNTMLAGLTMCIVVWLFWLHCLVFADNFRAGEKSDSACWNMLRESKQFYDLTAEDNNLIFTQSFGLALHRPRSNLELDRNLNVLVMGGSGSGKTFNYVTPNICQPDTNCFITDPKGTLLKDTGLLFIDNGYKVESLNTINLNESMHYNPLKHVKTDTDVLFFVNCYIMNTNGDDKAGDPFWESSEEMLYTSLVAPLRNWFPPEDYGLSNLLTLLSMAEARKNDENFKSLLDLLFLQIEEGKRYIPNEGGAPTPSMGVSGLSRSFGTGSATGGSDWLWEPTNLRRNSGSVRPTNCGGLSPDGDFALTGYKNFKVAADDICSK